jgi:putative RNA 2'-phosphotransferase
MMRATYGHTVEIELDLPTSDIPDSLYYPCDPEEAGNLLEVGIKPAGRAHVHLSANMRTAAEAGRVHRADPAIIEIDTARMVATGETIWHAGVTVYLTENVSGDYLSIVDPADPELSLLRETWLEEE